MKTILRIDSSARVDDSVTRKLSKKVVNQLSKQEPASNILYRDLALGLPLLNEEMVNAYFTQPDQRSAAQKEAIKVSDELVSELLLADTIVIGAPIYNFGVPAALKAWFDLVARAGVTFSYTDKGPVGLLEGKKAIIIISSGGTPIGSAADFASGHLQQFLHFIGISDIALIEADQLMMQAAAKLELADQQIETLTH